MKAVKVQRQLQTVGAFLALLLVGGTVLYGFRAGSSSVRRVTSEYLAASTLNGKETILIGARDDLPLVGYNADGVWSGFEIELARHLANSLGFGDEQIVFVSLSVTERISALQTGRVDIVVAGLAITDTRQALVEFAGPYLETNTAVLVPAARAAQIRTLSDLQGLTICSVVNTSALDVRTQTSMIVVEPSASQCVDGVRVGRYHAFVADSLTLTSYLHSAKGALAMVDLRSRADRLGIGLPQGDTYLRALLQYLLQHSRSAWRTAFDRTLGQSGMVATQPEITDAENLFNDLVPATTRSRTAAPTGRRLHNSNRRRIPLRRRPTREPVQQKPRFDWQGPWPFLLGIPIAVSALYLWIQSGGNLQLTLLLIQSVNPISFFTTMVLAALWQLSAVPILVLAMGRIILRSATDRRDQDQLIARYALASWAARTPPWVVWSSVIVAAISWPIIYLPWWCLALNAAIKSESDRRGHHRWIPIAAALAALLVSSLAVAIWSFDQIMPFIVIVTPLILLVLGTGGPIRRTAVPAFTRASIALAALLVVSGTYTIVTRPLLPFLILTVQETPTTPEWSTGGHVITADEHWTMILSESGQIKNIPSAAIQSQTTCFHDSRPGREITIGRTRLDLSILEHFASNQRPSGPQDPRCAAVAP